MSTLALPITELFRVAGKAKDETRLVKERSDSEEPSLKEVLQIVMGIITVKRRLSQLTTKQESLLASLRSCDFTTCTDHELKELALSIDGIVADERAVVSDARALGAEVRLWWQTSLHKLSEQAEHLDSIAESLHFECNAEASSLLAIAALQMT